MVSKAQVMALAAGDARLEKGANVLLFGPPGGGKSHLAAALGLALVEQVAGPFQEQHAENVFLVFAGIHAAAQIVAGAQQQAFKVG